VANQLLENNADTIVGAWQTVKGGNEKYLTQGFAGGSSGDFLEQAQYVAKFPANSDAQKLGDTLSIVLKNADQMEKVLTGKDNY